MDDEVKAGVDNLIRAMEYQTQGFLDCMRRDEEDYRRWAKSRGPCEDSSRKAWREHVEYERYLKDLREREEELSGELSSIRWELWNS